MLVLCIEQLNDTARKTCAQLAYIVVLVDVLHASGHGFLKVLLHLCQAVAFGEWMLLHQMPQPGNSGQKFVISGGCLLASCENPRVFGGSGAAICFYNVAGCRLVEARSAIRDQHLWQTCIFTQHVAKKAVKLKNELRHTVTGLFPMIGN
jgi:hypothetical protein